MKPEYGPWLPQVNPQHPTSLQKRLSIIIYTCNPSAVEEISGHPVYLDWAALDTRDRCSLKKQKIERIWLPVSTQHTANGKHI